MSTSSIITVLPVLTLAKISCMEEALNETECIIVSPGDVIGVVLPLNAGSKHLVFQSQYPINIVQSKLFTKCEKALDLYATVGK